MHSLIFFGSDRFSAVVLAELIAQNHPPQLVVTDPPKPLGRKQIITPNEVENIAKEHNLKVLYYQDNNDELINFIHDSKFKIQDTKLTGLSASFPHLFPPSFIHLFAGELYNLHPSLLPQYRNVAPGPYAIIMGDTETGITLQHIDELIDHGSIVAQSVEPILPMDTTTTLLTRLFAIGTKMFVNYLRLSDYPTTKPSEYSDCPNPVFTRKLTRQSGYVEWDVMQKLIDNKPIKRGETTNPLINLRLTHHPERTSNILSDLIRGLDGYEKVWTTVKTKKGDLTLSFSLSPNQEFMVLIPGKPKSISLSNFLVNYF